MARTRNTRVAAARGVALAAAIVAFAGAAGCRNDMHDQPRYKAFAPSAFFADGRASRPLVPGTVARGHLDEDVWLTTGMVDGQFVEAFPFPVDREQLERGRTRYDVHCAPCHARTGAGNGMIVQRGYKQPPSLHVERLRASPPGYFFNVITNGFATMPSYAAQIPVQDRWAIVGYIRALQLSQHAKLDDVPAGDRARLEGGTVAPPKPAPGHGHQGDGDA